jgi:hypothetical protein
MWKKTLSGGGDVVGHTTLLALCCLKALRVQISIRLAV